MIADNLVLFTERDSQASPSARLSFPLPSAVATIDRRCVCTCRSRRKRSLESLTRARLFASISFSFLRCLLLNPQSPDRRKQTEMVKTIGPAQLRGSSWGNLLLLFLLLAKTEVEGRSSGASISRSTFERVSRSFLRILRHGRDRQSRDTRATPMRLEKLLVPDLVSLPCSRSLASSVPFPLPRSPSPPSYGRAYTFGVARTNVTTDDAPYLRRCTPAVSGPRACPCSYGSTSVCETSSY